MKDAQIDSTQTTNYKIAWWVAFFLIFIVVGAATAGSIYPAVQILQSMFHMSFVPVALVPFVSTYVLPILPYIIQPLTHLGFLFSAFMWGKIYFNDTVTLLQRLFRKRSTNIILDTMDEIERQLDIDLEKHDSNNPGEQGKQSTDPAERMQHLQVFMFEKQIEIFHTLTSANENYQKSNFKWIHSIAFLRTIKKSLIQLTVYRISDDYLTNILDPNQCWKKEFRNKLNKTLHQFTEEKLKDLPLKFKTVREATAELKKFQEKFKISTTFKEFYEDYESTKESIKKSAPKKNTASIKEKSLSFWNWFSTIFFSLAVAGFNFAANLTAGVLLLNISQITNWQAVQATVLHNFASLAPFAKFLGILGGLITVAVLIPFLVSFIQGELERKNASTNLKDIPIEVSQSEKRPERYLEYVRQNKHKHAQSTAEKCILYVYEGICFLNAFLVNTFGIAFGTLAILSMSLNLISPGLQMGFPAVMSIAGVACFAGALAAITMTRNGTMASINNLFNRPVQQPKAKEEQTQWYAKVPRIMSTLANIAVLCAFTLSPTSYWSVLFGAPTYVRAIIAAILIPCIWQLTNKMFKPQDLQIQKDVDALSSNFFGGKTITPKSRLQQDTSNQKGPVLSRKANS